MEVLFTVEFLVYFATGLAGMFIHWLKRWARVETKLNYFQWLTVNKRYTVYAFGAYMGAIVMMLQTGLIDFGSIQSLATIFLAGYAIDSSVNREMDRKPVDLDQFK